MRRLRRTQNLPWLIAALALLVLAGFFRFALIGYGTIALACAGAAAVRFVVVVVVLRVVVVLSFSLCWCPQATLVVPEKWCWWLARSW